MNKVTATILTASLAIFSMFFGAGNLIFPLAAGTASGTHFWLGMVGFIATSVLLPLIGLVSIVLFNGDYEAFFARIGRWPGFLMVVFCMFVVGPLYAMPRIITLTYAFLSPFLPAALPGALFAVFYALLTFLAIYRESKVMDILAYIISPALLISLGIIIIKGVLYPHPFIPTTLSGTETFLQQAKLGYETLDLLGALFFGSIALTLLKKTFNDGHRYNLTKLALITIVSGLIACSMMAILYIGLGYLGAFYGFKFPGVPIQDLFMKVCIEVMGTHGSFVIAAAASLACYSTLMALAVVLAEFVQTKVTHERLSYVKSLVLVLGIACAISCYGLTTIRAVSAPYINTLYPVVITITVCNLAHQLWGFKFIRIPVFLTLVASVYLNFF